MKSLSFLQKLNPSNRRPARPLAPTNKT